MKLYTDLTNLILKYTYGFCSSCDMSSHYNKLHLDEICFAGDLVCFDCGWDTCTMCDIDFNRLTYGNIEYSYIENLGIVCPCCYPHLAQCEQCFIPNIQNIQCLSCGLCCCQDCKEDCDEMCLACQQLLEFFDEFTEG